MTIRRCVLLTTVILLVGIQMASRPLQAQDLEQDPTYSSASHKELFKWAKEWKESGRLRGARQLIMMAVEKKGKPDKKYQNLLTELNTELSDMEVSEGEKACAAKDLETCQEKIAAAKDFSETAKVIALEGDFDSALDDIRKEHEGALEKAEQENPEGALDTLNGLVRYDKFLPTIRSDIEKVKCLWAQKLVSQGYNELGEKMWNNARVSFNSALKKCPDVEGAGTGIDKAGLGENAYQLAADALSLMYENKFQEALSLNSKAQEMYPDGEKDRQKERKDITDRWLGNLLSELPNLMSDSRDFRKTCDAYLHLLQIRELQPDNPEVKKIPDARQNFVASLMVRGGKLLALAEEQYDYSRIAEASALYVNAEQLEPGVVNETDLKKVLSIFNRKRLSQLVIDVENLSAASVGGFTDTVAARTRSKVENMGMPDLRIRTKEEYEMEPGTDPEFQDLRPDGKSGTALLTIDLMKHESVRRSSEKPILVKSQYVSGKEKIDNPEYIKALEEIETIQKALDQRKNKKKPTQEGWTDQSLGLKKIDLEKIEKYIERDKILDYEYQKIEYNQHTTIELEINIRDQTSKEKFAPTEIIKLHDERAGEKILGVRDTDINGIQNQEDFLTPAEEVLKELQRKALEDLDSKVPDLVNAYTHRFYFEGEKDLNNRQVDEAVENFICHWTFLRGNITEEQSGKINGLVKRSTGFDLAKDGHILLDAILTVPVTR